MLIVTTMGIAIKGRTHAEGEIVEVDDRTGRDLIAIRRARLFTDDTPKPEKKKVSRARRNRK